MIKILLDTNIIVYRESDNVYKEKIGELFKIIDNNPDMYKYIHPIITQELLQNFHNEKRDLLLDRLTSYSDCLHFPVEGLFQMEPPQFMGIGPAGSLRRLVV